MKKAFFLSALALVAQKTGVSEQIIQSLTRTEEVLDARALVVYCCRKYGLSNKDIRLLFERNGHHFTQKMYDLCLSRKQFSAYYSALCASICKQLGVNE